MGWSVVKLSDNDISKMMGMQLQDRFESVFIAAHAPKDAAMFCNLNPTKDNYLFYFSPKATEIFSAFLGSSKDCAPPRKDSVALLVGTADALDVMLS
jgi:hypothetical protein